MRVLSLLSLATLTSAKSAARSTALKVTQQRKTFCTLLSFNGKNRNPSPTQCERTARGIALNVCNSLKAQGVAPAEDDNRCLSFLKDREAIKKIDCAPSADKGSPLFVRVTCPRFGAKKVQFSVYDTIESIQYLDPNGGSRARYDAFKAGEEFNYFEKSYWVYERETRCHGLIASGTVKLTDSTCAKYYSYEDDAVCNYLKSIFNDLWDLGCKRARQSLLGLAKFHCQLRFSAQLDAPSLEWCAVKGPGEDVQCDALDLICGSAHQWGIEDIALPPFFLSDSVLEQVFFFKNNGAQLRQSASDVPDDFPVAPASLDYLQHVIRAWRPAFGVPRETRRKYRTFRGKRIA